MATLSKVAEIHEYSWKFNRIGRLESDLSWFPITEPAEKNPLQTRCTCCSLNFHRPAVVETGALNAYGSLAQFINSMKP